MGTAVGLLVAWLGHESLRAYLLFFVAVPIVFLLLLQFWAVWQRERVICEATLPQRLKRKLRELYPDLSGEDAELVERRLRHFFLACYGSKRQFVAMPSKAVDAM